jgi:transposase
MVQSNRKLSSLEGIKGSLPLLPDDEISRKLAMLIEGECEGLGATKAAEKYGYSKQRYYQLRDAYREGGAAALQSEKRGPKTNYRRTPEVERLVIRYRFLDEEASPEVIAQKIRQAGHPISTRSVQRVIQAYGLQKKTPSAAG